MKKDVLPGVLAFLFIGVLLYFLVAFFKNQTLTLPLSKVSPETENQELEEVIIVAKNLTIPWDLVFLPDQSLLFTERAGKVNLINKEGKLSLVANISAVEDIGEGGLLGIALHPDFADNKYLYLYYTFSSNGENTLNRVVRYQFNNGELLGEEIIIEAIPGAINHNGGRIKFGPDKYLYITTGDAQNPSLAQDKNSLAGKILRVTDKGQPVADNPFNNLVYSYGHRNPQGLAWDNQNRLWVTEHGRSGLQSGLDELNLIDKGKNYGWPIIQGDEEEKDMVSPVIHSGPSVTWAPSGATFYNGNILFTGLRGEALFEYKIVERSLKSYFQGQFGRLRTVVVGSDGFLYLMTNNTDGRGTPQKDDDKLIKINSKNL